MDKGISKKEKRQEVMECVFCRIVKRGEKAVKLWEDNDFILILDKYPNTYGQALLITKKHFNTGIEDLPDEILRKLPFAMRKSVEILKKGLNVKKVGIVIEGTGVFHFHVKFYPMIGWNGERIIVDNPRIWFEKYPGYLCTIIGEEKGFEELERIRNKILENINS